MIRRFFRHIREGFYGVARHASMAFSSATAMTVTLILMSAFFMVIVNLTNITKEIEQEVQISVLIDYDHEEASVEESIGDQIKSIDGVNSVEFFTKDQEAQYYFDNYSETDEAIVEMIKQDNPLNDAFYVKVEDGQRLGEIAAEIESIEGVATVNYGGASVVSFMEVLTMIRNVGFIMVTALLLLTIFLIQNTIKLTIFARNEEISIMRIVGAKNGYIRAPFLVEGTALLLLTIFLIQNTIKLTIFARNEEISIMRIVGAKNGYIRAPFLVEGIIIGILGSVIPILFTIFGYIYIYRISGGVVLSNIFTLIAPNPFVIYVSLGLVGLSIVVGFVGSFFSVTKYLRWTR